MPTPAAATRYIDRVLDDSPQAQPAAPPGAAGEGRQGWPRGLQMDYALTQSTGVASTGHTVGLRAYLEPPSYGALSLACLAELGQPERHGAGCAKARLDWRRLPMDGDAWADLAAGDILSVVPQVGQGYARVLTPPLPLTGASAQWRRGESASLHLYAGRAASPNAFSTIGAWADPDAAALADQRASLISAGGQLRLGNPAPGGPHLDLALQVMDAHDVRGPEAGIDSPRLMRSRAVWGTAAWEGKAPWAGPAPAPDLPAAEQPGGLRLQANLLRSQSTGSSPLGVWLEADWRDDRLAHAAGAFRLAPALQWGTAPVLADLQGGYWRAQARARRWFLGWTVEASRPVAAGGAGSRYASVYGNYQLDARQALGATLSAREGGGRGRSLQLRWDALSRAGQTTARFESIDAPAGPSTYLGADHAWLSTSTRLLTTSLGWQATGPSGSRAREWSWAVVMSDTPLSRLYVDLSLRGTQGPQRRSWFADAAGQWQLSTDWSLVLRFARSGTASPTPTTLGSPLDTALSTPIAPTVNRFFQLVLRYQAQAGMAVAPLGGRTGDGAGEIQGHVYFDANTNGRQDANEQGAADVVVVLDGRYVTRTDRRGHFSFSPVAAGRHSLQVQTETVPLPWSPPEPSRQAVWVHVRGTARADLQLTPLR